MTPGSFDWLKRRMGGIFSVAHWPRHLESQEGKILPKNLYPQSPESLAQKPPEYGSTEDDRLDQNRMRTFPPRQPPCFQRQSANRTCRSRRAPFIKHHFSPGKEAVSYVLAVSRWTWVRKWNRLQRNLGEQISCAPSRFWHNSAHFPRQRSNQPVRSVEPSLAARTKYLGLNQTRS